MAIDNDFFDKDPELEQLIQADIEKNKVENPTVDDVTIEDKPIVDNKEENVLTDIEDKGTEKAPEKKAEDLNQVDFNVESFNRKFKTEYKTDEEIQSLFESKTQMEELRTSLSEKEKLILEKEELLNKKTDGLSLFAGPDMYKVNQALINNPDLNKNAVLQLAFEDVDKMDDKAVLKLKELIHLSNGSYDEDTIEYAINKKYSLTGDPTDLEGDDLREYKANEFLRNKDAQTARKELKELMNIEVPERVDLLAMQNDAKETATKAFNDSLETWKSKSAEVIKSLDKYVVEYDKGDDGKFEFAYDDKFKEYLGKNLPEYAARMGLDPTKPESLTTLKGVIENDFKKQKEVEIMKAFKQDLIAKWEDEAYRKKHNIKEPSLHEAPDVLTGDDKRNKEVNDNVLNSLDKQKYF